MELDDDMDRPVCIFVYYFLIVPLALTLAFCAWVVSCMLGPQSGAGLYVMGLPGPTLLALVLAISLLILVLANQSAFHRWERIGAYFGAALTVLTFAFLVIYGSGRVASIQFGQ